MPEQAQQFPVIISIPLFIFSSALLVKTAIRKKSDAIFDIANIRKVSILLFLMIVYVFLLPILGYFISSLLLFISTFIIMGYRKIIFGSITAVVVVTIIFFSFWYASQYTIAAKYIYWIGQLGGNSHGWFFLIGLQELAQLSSILFLLLGVIIGLIVGTLPGMNDNITIAVLIPVTFGMDPQQAIMLLVGIYCATCFGGSFPAILLKIPGTASSVVTTIDGYPMSKKGLAGQALGISTVSSTIGGVISGIVLITLSPFLAAQALKFGPPEYFSLIILGLCTVIGMARGNVIKSMIAVLTGLFIATIGMSPQTGFARFTFQQADLLDGVPLVPLMIGLFGVTAVLELFEVPKVKDVENKTEKVKVGKILPDKKNV